MAPIFSKLLDDDSDSELPSFSRKRKLATLIACICSGPVVAGNKFHVVGRNRNISRSEGRKIALSKIISLANNQPKYFQKMYRLHVDDFWGLYAKIKQDLTKKKTTDEPISCVLKLCAFLRWLAGGIHHDIAFGYDLPPGTIHAICKEVAVAIDKHVDNINFDIDNMEILRELEQGIFYI